MVMSIPFSEVNILSPYLLAFALNSDKKQTEFACIVRKPAPHHGNPIKDEVFS